MTVDYYSIDREPDICAKYVAQAIKVDPDGFVEWIWILRDKVDSTFEKMARDAFMGSGSSYTWKHVG